MQPSVIALAKHRFEVLAFTAIACAADQETEYQLVFEVPSDPESAVIEFLFQVVAAENFSLDRLILERTLTAIRGSAAEICQLENWVPFLQMSPRAHADPDGIVVSKGPDDFSVYGPFWTLPPGRYNMIASIVPDPASEADNPIITGQVVAQEGSLLYAWAKWRLGQFRCVNKDSAVEVCVPFTLSDALAKSRTIETRIYSPRNASFRLRSLAVRNRNEKLEHDWFPNLTIEEYGIHTGREIKTMENKFGLIASTPAMAIAPGHYQLFPQIRTTEANASQSDCIALELWSGSELIALETRGPDYDQPVQFNATDDIATKGIELRIRAITSSSIVSIHGLLIEKTLATVAPNPLPAVWSLNDWRPFLQTSPRVNPDQNDLVVSEGRDEFVVHGPHWTLPAGHYEMTASIIPHLSGPDKNPVVTVQVTGECGKRILAAAEWRLRQVRCPDGPQAVELRLPFTLAGDLPAKSRAIETRIFSPGNASFRIRSVAVKIRSRRTWSAGRAGFHIRSLLIEPLKSVKSLLKTRPSNSAQLS